MDDQNRKVWEQDAALLAEIGRALFSQDLRLEVTLPAALAARALAAWTRDDETNEDGSEPKRGAADYELLRKQAGHLGLIGLAVEERRQEEDGVVRVELAAWDIGAAFDAAEERNLL